MTVSFINLIQWLKNFVLSWEFKLILLTFLKFGIGFYIEYIHLSLAKLIVIRRLEIESKCIMLRGKWVMRVICYLS